MIGLLLVSALASPDQPPAAGADPLEWLVEPASAVAYVLAPSAPPPVQVKPTHRDDGALGTLAVRSLFKSYRTVLASQDDAPCSFVPSCSAFSEQAIDRFGVVKGMLLTADRLLRDHPLAAQLYPADAASGLLADPPSGYDSEAAK